MERTENVTIVRIDGNGQKSQDDLVVKEHALTLTINDRQFVAMMCSPSDLEALALGYLFSEGIIGSMADIESLSLSDCGHEIRLQLKDDKALAEKLSYKRAINASCGRGSMAYSSPDILSLTKALSDIRFPTDLVIRCSNQLQSMSELFKSTGGAHAAALCGGKGVLIFKEDIGRHNAVDKVFGGCMIKGIRPDDKILMTSCRISSEILLKAARRRIPIVASRSAPTSLAVELAKKAGMTLLGFVREGRMNIYSSAFRIES